MKKTILATFILGYSLFGVQVQAQDACQTPATVAFKNVAEKRADIVPSVHRQMSALGRLAETNSCTVTIRCVADPALDEAGRSSRNNFCLAVKGAVSWFESRASIRAGINSQYKIIPLTAGKGPGDWGANSVYVTLD